MTSIQKTDQNYKCFNSCYDYGPEEQRIKHKNWIVNLFEDIIVRPFKFMLYTGASFLKDRFVDRNRVQEAKEQLVAIGGQPVKMKTPDGDMLDGMYLNTKDFKTSLEKYFDLIEKNNKNGTIQQKLVLKKEFCVKEEVKVSAYASYIHLKPNQEANAFLETLKKLGIEHYSLESLSEEGNIVGYCIKLDNTPTDLSLVKTNNENNSNPTALIAIGACASFPVYKRLAAAYLLRGINVMMVDFRGYGDSEGSPTPYKTKLDLETAYQYLAIEKGIENKDLIVHGHSLGGGPAADLAARRKGTNLVLDRSFAEYRDAARDMVRDRFPSIGNIIHKVMPWIANYNNVKNIGKIEGNIAIVMAKKDPIISESQIIKQINSLPNTKKGQTVKLMDSNYGHDKIWIEEPSTSLQFNQFLEQTNLRRRLF
jgi:Serine aminopeptidase, S33